MELSPGNFEFCLGLETVSRDFRRVNGPIDGNDQQPSPRANEVLRYPSGALRFVAVFRPAHRVLFFGCVSRLVRLCKALTAALSALRAGNSHRKVEGVALIFPKALPALPWADAIPPARRVGHATCAEPREAREPACARARAFERSGLVRWHQRTGVTRPARCPRRAARPVRAQARLAPERFVEGAAWGTLIRGEGVGSARSGS
eukprot:scaffold471_cov235-Pinguiococcus_pyrenoidosus.AAC.7